MTESRTSNIAALLHLKKEAHGYAGLHIGYSTVNVVSFGTQQQGIPIKEPQNRWGEQWTSVIEAQK